MYATEQDMINRFSEQEIILLTERQHALDSIDSAVLTQAIADASAEIDGYLVSRYTLPLNHVPPVLARICCDIARYFLCNENAPEHIATRYQDALKFLKSVGEGKLSLGADALGNSAATNANTAHIESAGSVFARDKSKGFI